ncbi:hypothetical protein VPNG_08040 [Cytospora leucostoma]|uniref:Major facilitator superfamily (MFS) profile domain-containing protein n=1 Tax=Cytospora leucostoma TaxID=1230097 RepID=A0A423WRG3_9PEZI|nr:hypothetical protein VPNG_08040 [Cytospora leucostoma]
MTKTDIEQQVVEVGINHVPKDLSLHHSSIENQEAVGSILEGRVERRVSKARGIVVIVTLSGISFLNTMGSGILIAALPRIAADVGLDESLILWPAAVYALAAGCLLHVFGSIADIVGPKPTWITGSFLFIVFTIALGFSKTGLQVIMFRTCLGVAISMCLPTTVSLITNTFPRGKWRNTSFAMNGMAQPLGYALGLVLGGVFTDTLGWRWAYWIMAIINSAVSAISIWSLPNVRHRSTKTWIRRLVEDVDWVGVLGLSVPLGLIMYILASEPDYRPPDTVAHRSRIDNSIVVVTSDYRKIREPPIITLLIIALALIIAFPIWMHFQVRRKRPALIPNRLWRQPAFTAACLGVFFCWASLNGIEYFTTLYFQEIQELSALQSSIRYFSQIVMGTSINVALLYLIPRVRVMTLCVATAGITIVSPALMATAAMDENYWLRPFWALLLCPVNPWVLFSVSSLVISDAFPPEVQSLAGGVFNEVAQFGNSVGLAVTAAIAASVTEHSTKTVQKEMLMDGFRAAFWTVFANTGMVLVVTFLGFRKIGIIGK